ncbi:MAG: hypothetical protein ABI882_15525 [Acidobacteriota bacterium]
MAEADDRQWEDRLRDLLNSLVLSRLDPLASELNSLQTTFEAACSRLVDQARSSNEEPIDAIAGEMRQRLTKSEESFRTRIEALERDFEQAQSADRALLNASMAEIDRQRTQAGVLAATLTGAAAFAPRVALFVVRSGNVVGWRGIGFPDESVGIASLSRPMDDRTLLSDSLNQRQSIVRGSDIEPDYLSFLGSYIEHDRKTTVAVPLVVRKKAAAVLYADSEAADGLDIQPLEALMRVASMAIELLPLRRSTEPSGGEPVSPRILTSSLQGFATPGSASLKTETRRLEPTIEANSPRERDPEPAEPESSAEEKSREESRDESREESRETFVHDSTEALPVDMSVTSEIGDAIDSETTNPREHLDARRFARFLVGEIRLYQPSRVTEGCRRADLYDRLRDEIERSRKLYSRHVRSQITAEFDYFYHELVTTLAEGDATKLGRNFPVPQV